MKKIFLNFVSASALIITLFSCDKVENIYPTSTFQTDLDTTFYPGNWSDYLANEVPDFGTITASSDRNVIIEDFTGHNCSNCPQAATTAHNLHEGNPDRVFVASIHASPQGMSAFQATNNTYKTDFTNSVGLETGIYFGNLANSGFAGNPSGSVNRVKAGTATFYPAGAWSTKVSEVLASTLKVAMKSHLNYYEVTQGAYLHTEVEVLDNSLEGNLGMIVYLLEDSLVASQNVSSVHVPDYVHRDIHRKNISGQIWGRTLTPELKDENGKYYLDYSFAIPAQLTADGTATGVINAENMHLLIYVYDKTTHEIYQVIKQKIE